MFLSNINEGRGVAIYTKKSLNADAVKVETPFKESVWCKIQLQNHDSLILGCLYRSPNSNDDNNQALEDLLKNISNRQESHKLLLGDFNMPEINWESNTTTVGEDHKATKFVECIRDTFWFQHVKHPTRVRQGNEPSVLDLIFSNEENMVEKVNFLSSLGKSDHLVLTFNLVCYTIPDFKSEQKSKLNFFKGDYVSIREELNKIDWAVTLDGMDLLHSWECFADINIELMKSHIPVSKPPQDCSKSKPFITRQCLDAIKLKRRRWLKYKYCKSDRNFSLYKAARNQTTYEMKHAKYNYEKSLASKIKTDTKIFWKYVRSKSKTKSTVSKLQMNNGALSTTDQETATTLNSYFTTVFEKEPDGPLPEFQNRIYQEALLTTEISEIKVENAIEALKPSKSQGPDNFHPKYLKETKDQLKVPLKTIFENSLEESKIPEVWKQANVSAIFKQGEKQKPGNYRPISLTSVPGKLMERIIRDAIIQHMNTNNLFSSAQHGFIKGKSCTTQLLEFLEYVSQALDEGDDVDVIYLDFKKAFDKVPHRRLLVKLQGYGIQGKVLDWIQEFLTERKQRVVMNGSESEWSDVTSGIPQGSVLGPTLFLVYINDMPDVINAIIKLFADDAKVYNRVKQNEQPAENHVQSSLNRGVNWSNTWLMRFNFTKCHHMHIGKHNTGTKYTMQVGNDTFELETVKTEKDLGVTIDCNLSFRDHINSKVNLANRNLGIIFRTFTFLDEETFLNLYKSLVRPHVEYSTPNWSPYYKKDRIMIENVQRRATKLVTSLKNYSYPERLKKLGLPTLEYRRERADLIQVFKILNNIDLVDKEKLFTIAEYRQTRGHPFKLFKRRSRLNIRANSFSNRVVNSWNTLPENVVNAPSLNAFKSRLNKHWYWHPNKFEAKCYQVGSTDPNTRVETHRNAPEEV